MSLRDGAERRRSNLLAQVTLRLLKMRTLRGFATPALVPRTALRAGHGARESAHNDMFVGDYHEKINRYPWRRQHVFYAWHCRKPDHPWRRVGRPPGGH